MKIIIAAICCAALTGCASMLGPDRITGLAPIDRVDMLGHRFTVGLATKDQVFAAYGLACATEQQYTANPAHFGCIQRASLLNEGGAILQYMQTFTVLPGAFTDQAAADVSDSGVESMAYDFDAGGILREVTSNHDCSRYIGTVEFHNGCIDRLP